MTGRSTDAGGGRRRDELHAELYDATVAAMHQRRAVRRSYSSRVAHVDAVLAKYAEALQALPDD